MDEVYIKTSTLPQWLDQKYFLGQDLVSLEDLISLIEDLDAEVERLEEIIDEINQDIKDNYRFIPMGEQVGISDRDFI